MRFYLLFSSPLFLRALMFKFEFEGLVPMTFLDLFSLLVLSYNLEPGCTCAISRVAPCPPRGIGPPQLTYQHVASHSQLLMAAHDSTYSQRGPGAESPNSETRPRADNHKEDAPMGSRSCAQRIEPVVSLSIRTPESVVSTRGKGR